jgi:hypothetical protein
MPGRWRRKAGPSFFLWSIILGQEAILKAFRLCLDFLMQPCILVACKDESNLRRKEEAKTGVFGLEEDR